MRLTTIHVTLFLALLPGALLLNAQGYRATLDGRITDPSGAAVPNAAIALTNTEDNTGQKAKSNSDGRWTIPYVAPGSYTLSVEAKGFRKYVRDGFTVHVNDVLTFPVALQVGDLQQTITVSGDTPLLTPESASLGQVITNHVVTEMPLNGRNVMTLMSLASGVLPTNYSVGYSGVRPFDTGTPTYITTSGAPEKSNLFLLNGTWGKGGLNTGYVPSPDSVQEFKMQKNPYDAEYGHASGAVANVVTKSGTNEFHGTLLFFHRNSALDANAFFSNKVGRPKTPFHYNQFGGTLGGPVTLPRYNGKNRTFFFFNYEGLREIAQATTIRTTVPTALQKTGDFSATRTAGGAAVNIYDPLTVAADPARPGQFIRQPFAGNRIPQARFSTVAKNVLGYYPGANAPGDSATGLFNLLYPGSYPIRFDQYGGRVDHTISDKSRFYTMFGIAPYKTDTSGFPNRSGSFGGESTRHATVDYVRILSPNLVMDVNYGFNRKNYGWRVADNGFDVASLGF
ncbi:MAG: carboxypeptidase regulatory-like domain-containing protein, partial [Acidobacteria bacterium]|nr:carboxypeptidase regulatory-like domain-containing protein [Acidobacteriota bacterium]